MGKELIHAQRGVSGDLRLWCTDDYGVCDYELAVNGVFAMATYNRRSAVALYQAAARALGPHTGIDVLVAGLGVGYTVAAAAADPGVRSVDVVELEPAVPEWNRQYFAEHNKRCLDDARVHVHVADFGTFVRQSSSRYDVVCMDVDNGPAFLIMDRNQSLYGGAFLAMLRDHLRLPGVLSVWSSTRAEGLEASLAAAYPRRRILTVTEDWSGQPLEYYVYLAEQG